MFALNTDSIDDAVAALSPNQLLCQSGEYEVWVTNAATSPEIVEHIASVRLEAFGQAGASANARTDRDRYDDDYLQLFLWHRTQCRVVGGYRLGLVDRLLALKGVNGLYSSSLFTFSEAFIGELSNAIELGRSFIVSDHQRSFTPLLLLWKGISTFLYNNPRYHVLLGSVGIHDSYSVASQQLITEFLACNHLDKYWAEHVLARSPVARNAHKERASDCSFKQLSKLVSELEPDAKGVPVLIRQYLKLGAEFLDFHVDKDFGSTACLLRVDLRYTPQSTLARYMGKAEVQAYQSYHQNMNRRSA